MLCRVPRQWWWMVALILGCLGGSLPAAWAVSIFSVSLDTSGFSGSAAQLAFDLTSADPAANMATITNFSTNGSLGAASITGGPVTGALPGTTSIADTAFFNELLQDITLGTTVTFTLALTADYTGGSLPDQLAFFLLDAGSGVPLFATADPTGADALFTVDITGTVLGDLHVFAATAQVTTVPEPATFWLVIAGVGALAVCQRCSSRRRAARLVPGGQGDRRVISSLLYLVCLMALGGLA